MNKYFYLLLILLLIPMSCNNGGDPEIIQLLDKRETAYEQKDTALYSTLLSKNYESKTGSGTEARETALKNFKINTTPFDKIDMKFRDRTIYKEDDRAKVVQKTTVELQIENKKSTYELTEIIVLVKNENKWEIAKESKIDLFRGYVFGENS